MQFISIFALRWQRGRGIYFTIPSVAVALQQLQSCGEGAYTSPYHLCTIFGVIIFLHLISFFFMKNVYLCGDFILLFFIAMLTLFATPLSIQTMANNLELQPWDWSACLIAIFSLIVSVLAAIWQWKTEKNTTTISSALQQARLKGFYRHLYRNMICCRAMEIKLKEVDYRLVPSAEHILKLRLDEDDIHEEAFYKHSTIYEALKELKLQVRNVNIEIDVADKYLCSAETKKEAKERIMKTLYFKQGYIAMQVYRTLTDVFGATGMDEFIVDIVEETARKNRERNETCQHAPLKDEELFTREKAEKETANQIVLSFKKMGKMDSFIEDFNTDVMIETGLNKDEEPKIALF